MRMSFDKLEDLVADWHEERNLIEGSTDQAQFIKLIEEVGELANSIAKNRSWQIVDDIGDILVVLINIAERNNLYLSTCLDHAYDQIKDRKGKLIGGNFVKEEDL